MKQYDPKQVSIIVGGVPLSGFADGTFIRVGRRSPAWDLVVGTDGEGTRAKSNDKSGYFEFDLMQSSVSNQTLSALSLTDELTNTGVVPVLVKDGSGASLHTAEQAFVEKNPDSEYARVAGPRTWRLLTDNLIDFLGGNQDAGTAI